MEMQYRTAQKTKHAKTIQAREAETEQATQKVEQARQEEAHRPGSGEPNLALLETLIRAREAETEQATQKVEQTRQAHATRTGLKTEQKVKDTEQKVKGGLNAFFDKLVSTSAKAFVSGILGAALFPIIGPAAAATMGVAAAMISIQKELKALNLDLQEDTVHKLVEPLKGKQVNESELRKVIEEEVLPDRQANEDLYQLYHKLLGTIQNAAAASTNINIGISGPVWGLISGDNNTITQTYNSFLREENVLLHRQANEDLKQSFIDRPLTTRNATAETNVVIDGPVWGLITGDENEITQTFDGPQEKFR
jgi:hypothetical protein